MHNIFRLLATGIFCSIFTLIFIFSFEVNKNYKASKSGPFSYMDNRLKSSEKIDLLLNNLKIYFLQPRRADEVSIYMVENNGFDCHFSNQNFVFSQVKQSEKGSTMTCSYRFGGFMYILPENLLLFISFDQNFNSIDFSSIINDK